MQAKQIVLANRPEGLPKEDNFKLEQINLPDLEEGQVLLEPQYFSVDPYMRGRMNESKIPGAAFELNEPLIGAVVAKVTESKNDKLTVGSMVSGNLPWATKIIDNGNQLQKIDTTAIPASAYLGLLGMPGLTGYFGLLNIGKPKSGETVVISGAAGAIGTVIGQIAKLKGCYVVGLAGSDDKVKLLKEELGYDEVINYKTQDIQEALKAACPNGVDVYFDNVGGKISDAVIQQLNLYARVAVCGQISTYNNIDDKQSSVDLLPLILNRSIIVQGYHLPNYKEQFPEAIAQLSAWFKEGKIKNKETIVDGFDKLPEAFLGLFSGKNEGKMLVKA
ncbi:MAG: NADP-dependent oxidoreductase [Janthinobacterium lividum]